MITDAAQIPLFTRNGAIAGYAQVDANDGAWLGQWTWRLLRCRTCYATRTEGGKPVLMHRAILGLRPGDPLQVDHIDGDGLNNRRANLRVASRDQNAQNQRLHANNRSGYRGVYWRESGHSWCAQVRVGGRKVERSGFRSAEEAAVAASAIYQRSPALETGRRPTPETPARYTNPKAAHREDAHFQHSTTRERVNGGEEAIKSEISSDIRISTPKHTIRGRSQGGSGDD